MTVVKEKVVKSTQIPLLLIGLMWLSWILEKLLSINLDAWGVFPRHLWGLCGIFMAPFIHDDLEHLMSNTPGVMVLSTLICYFYPSISKKAVLLIYLLSGLLVWIFARPYFHIGASGLIYGFVFFLFFSAVFRNDMRSLAISMFVTFFYGSLVWGLLPYNTEVSWEMHLAGAISGTTIAFWGRHADVYPRQQEPNTPADNSIPTYREYKQQTNVNSEQ